MENTQIVIGLKRYEKKKHIFSQDAAEGGENDMRFLYCAAAISSLIDLRLILQIFLLFIFSFRTIIL